MGEERTKPGATK